MFVLSQHEKETFMRILRRCVVVGLVSFLISVYTIGQSNNCLNFGISMVCMMIALILLSSLWLKFDRSKWSFILWLELLIFTIYLQGIFAFDVWVEFGLQCILAGGLFFWWRVKN